MNTRVLLAVALSMFVIITYQHLFFPTPQVDENSFFRDEKVSETVSDAETQPLPSLTDDEVQKSLYQDDQKSISKDDDKITETISEPDPVRENIIKDIETSSATYFLQSRNGSLTSIKLNEYFNPVTKENRQLIEGDYGDFMNPLKLLFSYDDDEILSNQYYEIISKDNHVTMRNRQSYKNTPIEIQKEFIFSDDYIYDFVLTIKNKSSNFIDMNNFTVGQYTPDEIKGSFGLMWFSGIKNERDNYRMNPSVLFGTHNSVTNLTSIGSITPTNAFNNRNFAFDNIRAGNPDWIATSSAFFTNILIPDKMRNTDIRGMKGIKSEDVTGYVIILDEFQLSPNGEEKFYFQIYSGPKKYDVLRAINEDKNLQNVIDFGWTKSIAIVLLYTLNWFYGFIPDYGVAIILLTILVNIIMFPLKHKSTVSMESTKKVQPQINALKEKYKKDKQKFQQELMKLYREHKINPVGGCLPIIFQIPIFFGLYNMLIYAIELRGANFSGTWLNDLSQADPYYILPILFGASMFIQQKLTPMPGGAEQQKILMYIMPFFLTFLFLNFSSGLVLYFVVNNLITFAQHIYIQKKLKKAEA